MSDRASAEIFGAVFNVLAGDGNPSDDRKALARTFWDMSEIYDFHPSQMDCDDSLVALGLPTRRE